MISPTITEIERIVMREFKLPVAALRAMGHRRRIARPRAVAMYLAFELTDAGKGTLAAVFNCDRTTILHAHERVGEVMRENEEFAEAVDRMRTMILSRTEYENVGFHSIIFAAQTEVWRKGAWY